MCTHDFFSVILTQHLTGSESMDMRTRYEHTIEVLRDRLQQCDFELCQVSSVVAIIKWHNNVYFANRDQLIPVFIIVTLI
jgi:hypothetical protein